MKRYSIPVLLVFFNAIAMAQGPPDNASLVRVTASVPAVAPGKTVEARVVLTVQPGWHVNSNKPAEDFLRPTIVSVRSATGIKTGTPRYPAARTLKLSFSATPMSVFEGKMVVVVPLTAAKGAKPGRVTLKGMVDFQPCNATSCFAPATKPFTLVITVKPPPAVPAHVEPVRPPPSVAPPVQKPVTPAPPAPATGTASGGDPWSHALETRGLLAFLGLLFAAGLALNLTPCVYPMIAVTMSIFGARAGEARGKVVGKAIVYVLGMATMYTGLGLFAALTGSLFGGVLQSVWVQVGIGVFLLVLAMGMFGVYELQPPPKLAAALGGTNRSGTIGIYFSGLVVGIFAAPCVGPVVLGLLAMVGARRDIGFGALSFFTLAMGLGAPYIVLASSTGLLGKLPRSGGWMETVKHIFGLILIAVAVRYFVQAFAKDFVDLVVPLALVAGATYMAFMDGHAAETRRFRLNKRVLSLLVVAGGAYLGAGAWGGIRAQRLDDQARWPPYSDAAFAQARSEGRPIVLDFGASWCAACKELEHVTFRDPKVIAALKPFARLRVELDGENRGQEAELRARWNVKGLPDVVFLDGNGAVITTARVGGYLPPDKFIEKATHAK